MPGNRAHKNMDTKGLSMNRARLLGLMLLASLSVTGCGGGGGSNTTSSSTPSAVTAVIRVTNGVTANPMNNTMQAVVGRPLQLSAAGSSGTGGAITTYQWSVTSR